MRSRRLPIGAELTPEGVEFRVWAPTHDRVTLVLEGRRDHAMERDPKTGYHAVFVPDLRAGARYRFRLGDGARLVTDPASRFQPEGPHGPSEVVDPGAFAWSDAAWRGHPPHRHVLYELHVGTFTPAGTWTAATAELPFLAQLGVTTLELMPVNGFAGRHGWGYDGVNLFAPHTAYGTPDDFRRFVDRAHALDLAVILDVVYNHFGPAGNDHFAWSPHYKADGFNEWGDVLAYGEEAVREFFAANAAYWIDEFHLDGLRLDATQAIRDDSPEHILGLIARRARAAGGERQIFLVAENEPQDTALLAPAIGLDAMWNDDFHHAARVALTGSIDGYLHDYRGTPQELLSAVKYGFLYQGQLYPWQRNPRGTSTRGTARRQFVQYLENHDQCANLSFGARLGDLAHPGAIRALTALLLLSPELPMLFQGQEVGARQPWRFFVDHAEDLHEPIRNGRASFMAQFPRLGTPEARAALYDPNAPATFEACRLEPAARTFANPVARLHRDLLALRTDDPAFTADGRDALDGAVLGPHTLALRFFHGDRLLLVNLGPTFTATAVPEPLIAPPADTGWKLAWSSEHPDYGGHGTPRVFDRVRLAIPAYAAVLLVPDRTETLREDPPPPSGDKEAVEP